MHAPPFLVRASGAVALKVAQVPSTESLTTQINIYCIYFSHVPLTATATQYTKYIYDYDLFMIYENSMELYSSPDDQEYL